MQTLKSGDKLLCKYNFPMSYVCNGGKYTFKSYDSILEGFINLAEYEGKYSADCFEVISCDNIEVPAWTHERSALVHLMLLEGYNYIMCKVAEEDRDFEWMDSLDIVIITTAVKKKDGSVTFGDIEGNIHTAAQPIKGNGNIMSYDDYLMLKQLKEVINDK